MTKRTGGIWMDTDFEGVIACEPRPVSGAPVGIVCVELDYPKIPGNVVNASTFDYPVMYEVLSFDIERLFAGDSSIRQPVVDAALSLQRRGARVVVGACGYFAHFQRDVADALDVPVFMSSLCQLPLVRLGLRSGQKIAVMCADGASLDDSLLACVGETLSDLIVVDVSQLDSFGAIRWGKTRLDNGRLASDLARLTQAAVSENPSIGAFLLECSDLPPYALDIQRATSLPVYDFITLIDWAKHSVAHMRYGGFI